MICHGLKSLTANRKSVLEVKNNYKYITTGGNVNELKRIGK